MRENVMNFEGTGLEGPRRGPRIGPTPSEVSLLPSRAGARASMLEAEAQQLRVSGGGGAVALQLQAEEAARPADAELVLAGEWNGLGGRDYA